MEFRLLGPVTIVDGTQEVAIRQRRQRALLARLLLHPGEAVPVERIIEDLWGADSPRTALASLHNAVSQLRRLVGAELLVTRAPGYALEVEPERVDAVRFEHLLVEAQSAFSVQDHATAAVVLREALGLWRGPALSDLAYEPFAQAEIRRLEELRLTALEERLVADLELGRHEDAVPELERLVAGEPLREGPYRLLMLALYRSGRQADALATYRGARRLLVGELGIEPGPELKALEQSILRQDASLLAPGSVPAAGPAPARHRRFATILFADAGVGSADEGELDPELVHELGTQFFEAAQAVLRRHGGWVDRVAGEVVMAAFGAQAADEHHALRAARAALDLRQAVAAFGEATAAVGARLELRIGVAAGEVLVSGTYAHELYVSGESVQVASGLQQAAAAGEIAVGPFARRLLGDAAVVESLGEIDLRGRTRPVAAFRLVELTDVPPSAERLEAPFVGRGRELRALRAALREARRSGTVHAICVLGPAGIGKSRLAREVVAAARGFDALVAGCPEYGDGLTYLPVRELVGKDGDAIAAALGDQPNAGTAAERLVRFDGPAPEIAWAFATWCAARARRRPLLLVVDDLHRAEPTFLDLLAHVAAHAAGPIALVGLAREEVFEAHPDALPGWERIELGGLAPTDTETLVDHLLAGAPLPPEARTRAFDAAEGNPLFLEQLVAFAAEGASPGREEPLPATLQALLAARLDRLGPGERAVLERAALVGREFAGAQLAALLDPEAVPTTERHLAALVRRGFLRPAAEQGAYRFRHVLVQEAAYRATPKALRSELHECLADVLDRDRSAPDAIIGYHLEQAYRLRTELAPPDRAARRLAEDAGRRLGAAGIRAWRRYDAPAANNLLGRAASLLPTADTGRLELLCELGTVLKFVSDDVAAEAVLSEASELAEESGQARLHLRAELERAWPRYVRGEIASEEILALSERAIPVFEAVGDDRGLGRAWVLVAAVRSLHGRWAACRDAAARALDCHQRSGFSGGATLSLQAAAVHAGPEPVELAIEYCDGLVSGNAWDRSAREHVLTLLAHLEAMRGRFDRAREALEQSRAFFEERGGTPPSDWVGASASVEMLAGVPARAEEILLDACAGLEASGERAWLATLEAALAEAVFEQARLDEAATHARKARDLASADDLTAQTAWRRALARATAAVGDAAAGEVLAREALAMLEDTDALNDQAITLVALAEVLFHGGQRREARKCARRGLDVLGRKGNMAEAARTRRRLAVLDPTGTWGEEALPLPLEI